MSDSTPVGPRERGVSQQDGVRHRRRDETSFLGGLTGITAVLSATVAVSLVGALIALIVALVY